MPTSTTGEDDSELTGGSSYTPSTFLNAVQGKNAAAVRTAVIIHAHPNRNPPYNPLPSEPVAAIIGAASGNAVKFAHGQALDHERSSVKVVQGKEFAHQTDKMSVPVELGFIVNLKLYKTLSREAEKDVMISFF
jgi:hypothetical protein